MAYDQNDRDQREQRSRYEAQQRDRQRGHDTHGGHDTHSGSTDRGFFERASDEVSSWFGDDEAERRREMDERSGGGRSGGGRNDYGRDEGRRPYGTQQDQGARHPDDGPHRPYSARPPERSEAPRRQDMDREQGGYRPMTGDYGRAASERSERAERSEREQSNNGRPVGSGATAAHDRHYSEWRQRQIDQIDRDYDDYRREHQSKFESDFSNWRSTRQTKREMLGSIKEHMQVFGSDDQPVGIVDKVRGDRVILTKNDSPDGQHHSINLALIERVEGDRVMLGKSADEARASFGSEERDRALNERDNQGEDGPHILNRSFSGTY